MANVMNRIAKLVGIRNAVAIASNGTNSVPSKCIGTLHAITGRKVKFDYQCVRWTLPRSWIVPASSNKP